MTLLECGSCRHYANEILDVAWFDGHTVCQLTVGCAECGAETVYEYVEPHELRVHEEEVDE